MDIYYDFFQTMSCNVRVELSPSLTHFFDIFGSICRIFDIFGLISIIFGHILNIFLPHLLVGFGLTELYIM